MRRGISVKKKILALVLALVLAMCAFSGAFACGHYKSNYYKAVSIVNSANARIRALVRSAQLTPYYDVPQLIAATEAIAASTKVQVRMLGYRAECDYAYYWVDGRYVAIDPLYVVNPLPNSKPGNDNA